MVLSKKCMHFVRFLALAVPLFFSSTCGQLTALEEETHASPSTSPKVPFDFLMDFLKPLGMPLVTSYHTIRENVFFNMQIDEANTLESIGNFFLTPAQYLFAGKSISVDKASISQRFDYNRHYWTKSIAALISLPITEPLGAFFKGIAYLSDEVRQRHARVKKMLSEPSHLVSHLEEYRQKGIALFHCDSHIPCQAHKRPSHLTPKQKAERQAFEEIIALLDRHNILYWIDCGTCLGAYRYGGIIPWDIDIDIAIFQADHENVKRLLSTLDPKKYQIQDWSSYSKPQTFLKLYVKETKNLIDIYHYSINDNGTIAYYYSYEDSPFPDSWKKIERGCTKPLRFDQVFPLKKASFDGLLVWAPNHVVEFLQSKYGENLDPSMLWDENTHAYVKVAGHPYWKL